MLVDCEIRKYIILPSQPSLPCHLFSLFLELIFSTIFFAYDYEEQVRDEMVNGEMRL